MNKIIKIFLYGFLSVGVIILILTAIGGYKNDRAHETKEGISINGGKDDKGRGFTEKELIAANLALDGGISIDDPKDDWYKFPEGSMQSDGRPDNANPYPLGWTDYRNVGIGADQNYIYFKFQFWDIFPKNALVYNGDLIQSTSAKITNFKFINSEGKVDSADLIADSWYASFEDKNKPADKPSIGAGAMISPMGIDEMSETIFKVMTDDSMIAGGPGYDYILCAFPLSLFNLKLGDEVTFDSATETGSNIYHHEAMDTLLGEPDSKFGKVIRYQLGSNQYELVPNPDYSGHS